MGFEFVEPCNLPQIPEQRKRKTAITTLRRKLIDSLQIEMVLDQLGAGVEGKSDLPAACSTAWHMAANSPAGAVCGYQGGTGPYIMLAKSPDSSTTERHHPALQSSRTTFRKALPSVDNLSPKLEPSGSWGRSSRAEKVPEGSDEGLGK